MKDYFGREIQIGDKCVLLRLNSLEKVTVLDVDDYQGGRAQVLTGGCGKIVIHSSDSIIDITSIERETHKQHFINSVKALDVKPNDTVIASIVPEQITYDEAQSLFDSLKEIFPDNKVTVVMGLNISTE